ncbi:MAG: TrmJ/YjtD family RNA methyltransferase [bacterium]|nr:TrmJ/YjtD family RNA methyltransferase [bacterium]
MSDASLPSLDNVVVVLSRPTEPMNIGAACRAMKTMGLSRLRLIAPLNPKGRSARALAHGAEDILDNALVVDDLLDAVSDALVVTGTTARERQLRKRALLTPAELADHIADHSREGRVVIMFGTERTGLTNDEIDICRHLSTVDTAPEQPSLNLAQAVMLYGWEIRQAMQRAGALDALGARGRGLAPRGQGSASRPNHPHRGTRLPTQGELDHMYAHLAHAMAAIGYTPRERLKFLTYLRHLHMRAGIVNWETHIYHILARHITGALRVPRFQGLPGEPKLADDELSDEALAAMAEEIARGSAPGDEGPPDDATSDP